MLSTFLQFVARSSSDSSNLKAAKFLYIITKEIHLTVILIKQ